MAPIISTFGSGSARGFGQAQFVLKGFAFTSATFTPGGATQRFGPSISQAKSGISSLEDDSWKNDTAFFDVSGGIQQWTVPVDGTYRIRAAGSKGGEVSHQNSPGNGMIIEGHFQFNEGDVLNIAVGQQGYSYSPGETGSGCGGGGGTFVVDQSNNPIIVAGGGGAGGDANDNGQKGTDGVSSTQGGSSPDGTGSGGVDGDGGGSGNYGAGGAGFYGEPSDYNGGGASSYVNGAIGARGYDDSTYGVGGFGGSGAGAHNGGGGGGYSGGGGGDTRGAGAGGGSFISQNVANPATSNGTWTITGSEPDTPYSGSVSNLSQYNTSGPGFVEIERLEVQ